MSLVIQKDNKTFTFFNKDNKDEYSRKKYNILVLKDSNLIKLDKNIDKTKIIIKLYDNILDLDSIDSLYGLLFGFMLNDYIIFYGKSFGGVGICVYTDFYKSEEEMFLMDEEMKENYQIEIFLKNNSLPGIRQISNLTKKKNDKEVLLQKQKYNTNNEILDLLRNRFQIKNPIERIEAYDNSFFGNNYAVASYVVFNSDGFSIKDSRTYKFKDYDLKQFGDADLMRKVFDSRFSKDDKIIPDVIIIDGGIPYLKICMEALQKHGISEDIFLLGVTKGHKRDFRFDRYHTLQQKNLSLKENPQIEGFIQKMRDKAHNLSKKNSLKRMSDAMKTSVLDGITGIGKIKKMRVINFFGNVQNLKQASKEELSQIKGLNSKNIKDILEKVNG